MKMMNKFCALMLSVALCAGMAAPAFAYGGEPVEEAEQPVLTSTTEEEEAVTVTDEESGALTPEGNLTLVDDYHTSYSDGSGQQFITLVSKSGNTFYLVIDRNSKGAQTVHFMNLVDEADLLALMEEEDADAYTAEKEAPQGQDFFMISALMISRQRHQPVSIRRFITRRLPQITVPHTLMSRTENWMRYSHICSLWGLFHVTKKPGSSALPIKPAP